MITAGLDEGAAAGTGAETVAGAGVNIPCSHSATVFGTFASLFVSIAAFLLLVSPFLPLAFPSDPFDLSDAFEALELVEDEFAFDEGMAVGDAAPVVVPVWLPLLWEEEEPLLPEPESVCLALSRLAA